MLEMYKGVVNSPETTITNNITNTDTTIYILDETRVPEELPNLMVLGTGIGAETIRVLSRVGTTLTVERGFQGVARAWDTGTLIARNFTEYDYEALRENLQVSIDNISFMIDSQDYGLITSSATAFDDYGALL